MQQQDLGGLAYAVVNDILAPRIIVDVDCHAAQGRDFGGEFIETRVVLAGVVSVG